MPRTTSLDNKPPLGLLVAGRLLTMEKTQKWLAESAEVDQVYLNKVLAGRVTPTISWLRKIAAPLQLDIKDLVIMLVQ